MKQAVVVTGGGTGGHLKVADVFIEEFFKRGFEIVFIGSINGQDKAWFEEDNRIKEKYFLDIKGVVNKRGLSKVFSLFNILSKIFFCLKIYKKYDVKKVISVGGFSAAPASFAAILKRDCKFYIHEQNSKMGKLNQITSRFAKKVFSSFDENSPIKDYPVSKVFFEMSRVRNEVKTVIFLGGSQGAVCINNFALKVASKLNKMNISIIHQTGKSDLKRVEEEYEKLGIKADIFDFTKELPFKMQQADFAVSRSGASTLWEVCANCLPTFFIPFKYAAADHQYFNAKALQDKNLCFLQREEELDVDYFFKALNSNLEEISIGLKSTIKPNAISSIIDVILEN